MPLWLNESRWTARGVSSRLRYDPGRSLAQPLKRPTVLAVARAVPAIVWVACPAGVVGANDHATAVGTRDGFAMGSQHATAAGVARRTSAVSRKAKPTNASRLPIRPR
jgi:hypothetical protein